MFLGTQFIYLNDSISINALVLVIALLHSNKSSLMSYLCQCKPLILLPLYRLWGLWTCLHAADICAAQDPGTSRGPRCTIIMLLKPSHCTCQ